MSVVYKETCPKCGIVVATRTTKAKGLDEVETISYVKTGKIHVGCKPTSLYPERWKEKR